MKIAYLVSFFPVLSQTFILNQITGLIELGHDVEIFAAYPGTESKIHGAVQQYDLLSRTHYWGGPTNKLRRILGALPLIRGNLRFHSKGLVRALNPLLHGRDAWNLQALYRWSSFLERRSFDVIHAHFGPNGLIAARLIEEGLLQGKLVTTFHGHDMSLYLEQHGDQAYELLRARGDLALPISMHWKTKLEELGFDPCRVVVHRMGVDTGLFEYRPRERRGSEPTRILSVARLTEKKGIEYGIRAISRLVGRLPGIEYRIVGDGPLRPDLDDLICRLGVSDHVKILGWKNQDEVAQMLEDSHLLILPSVTSSNGDQEGIPVVLMEAMARGLPVLATIHSGIPELIEDGVSGYLVPERDTDALSLKLEHLVAHPEIWPEFGRAGRTTIEGSYDINGLNRGLVSLFESA